MQTNMFFDICAVVAIATLILALIARKLVKGRNNLLFLALSCVILISGFTDAVTIYYDNMINIDDHYTMLRYGFNYVYFIARNATTPIYLAYICSLMGLWHKMSSPKSVLFYLWIVPYAIDIALLAANQQTNCIFYFDENFVYTRGPLMIILYAVAFYYLFLAMYLLIHYRKLLSRGNFAILIVFIPINFICVIIQSMSSIFRIEVFASAVFSITLAVSVHRPEEMIDFVVGLQSLNSFLKTTRTAFNAKNPKTYLFIRFTNYRTLRSSLGLDTYLLMLRNISEKMEQMAKVICPRAEIFYLDRGAFAVVAEKHNYDQLLDLGRILAAYLLEPMKLKQMEVVLDARTCLVLTPDDISSEASLLRFMNSFHDKLPEERRVMCLSQISQTNEFKMKNDMDTIINRGIAENNFEMYYQPIYSTKAHKFVSAEALIRLKDSIYGFVSPALFIPAAEESGAIHEIGDFVIEDVCRFIGGHNFEELGLEYIELNLSVAQCIESNLYEKIDECMKRYGVRPEQINLEITETSVDYDPETTDANIKKLHDAGLSFSLDDYGTGYSNIARVVSLPLDIVKLDKTLVDEMDTTMMWIVIKNTVSMLKRMNKKILVEGIEEKRALDRFTEIGCDYIQGYYFSKPLPAADFLKFILKENCGIVPEEN